MTDLEAFTAAYMAACKDRPSAWNEIGYWYARQLWDAAIKAEREASVSEALAAMTDEQRMELIANYCKHCGRNDPGCQCWNDE